MPYRGNEFERFNAFVHSLYIPQSEESLRRTIANGLLRIIPGENAGVGLMDVQTLTFHHANLSHPVNPDFLGSYGRHFTDNPMLEVLGNPRHPSKTALSDFISSSRWHRTPLYNEAFRPERLKDLLGFEIGRLGSTLIPIAVFREKAGFSNQDRRLMALLLPHFEQAFKNARDLKNAIPTALAAQAHADLTEGMILLDEQRQILHCSESTRHLLGGFFPGVSNPFDHLPAELEAQLDNPATTVFRKIIGHQTLKMCFYRDKASGRYLLITQLLDSRAVISRLGALGLSPREAEVLYWIGQGKRNEEIATILNLSIYTVKTHIKSIFRRLGVETRTAAAAAAIPFIKI